MSENTKSVKSKSVKSNKSNKSVKGTRGRKPLEVKRPKSKQFTVNDVIAANPTGDGFICRATADKAIRKWRKTGEVSKTKETLPTGGVGKPATIFQFTGVTVKAKAKAAPKTDLASTPAVDVTPVPADSAQVAPVTATVEAPVAEPVAA